MGKRYKIRPVEIRQPKPKVIPFSPEKVLREFVGYGKLLLGGQQPPCGPRLQGHLCMASWVIRADDEEVQRFQQVHDQLGNCQRLFHGTPAKNIGSITREGLRTGGRHGGMFGGGIYFGDVHKAVIYSRKGAYTQEARYILEADVVLGTSLVAPEAHKYTLRTIQSEGFSSVHGKQGYTKSWGGTLYHDEWVVYSTEQVMLRYVHEYQPTRIEIEGTKPQQKPCRVARHPKVYDIRGKSAWLDILEAPKACGVLTYTVVEVAGSAALVPVCDDCLRKHDVRVGSRFDMVEGKKVVSAKVKRQGSFPGSN